MMRSLGQFLMGLGAAVGIVVALAMFAHLGLIGVPWLVNVALAKLGFVASLGLMTAGAVAVRLANRHEQAQLPRSES
jgi:hypothetical protein